MAYLHRKKIAHRGIKPNNVFFEEVDSLNVKLMNFRNSIKMGNNEELSGINGNIIQYGSSEVLSGNDDEICDIWSVEIILYMLLSGNPSFDRRSDLRILDSVKKGEY